MGAAFCLRPTQLVWVMILASRCRSIGAALTCEENPLRKLVPTEGVEPTHSSEYQILSLARLPIPPRRHPIGGRTLAQSF